MPRSNKDQPSASAPGREYGTVHGFCSSQVSYAGRWGLYGDGGAQGEGSYGTGFFCDRSEPYFLEIMPKGIDKALSLARLLEKIGLTKDQMIACGDR